jgi:hypothetical protein
MQDTSAIIEYLDRKFSALDIHLNERFDEMFKTFATSEEVGELKIEILKANSRIDDIYQHLDKQAQREEAFHQELLMLGSQVSRHERWHHATAKQLGMKLVS